MFGVSLHSVNPHVIGMIAVIAYDTIGNGIKVAKGELPGREMLNVFISETFVSACALAGGGLLSTGLGPIGYLLGSLLGSIIGGISYQAGKRIFVSLCVEAGFTLFGLVRQDYSLPEEVIRDIGGDVFESEEFIYSEFEPVSESAMTTMPQAFRPDEFIYDTISIRPLRRGVLSVSLVGYV